MGLSKLPTFAKLGALVISIAAALAAENKDGSLYQWLTVFIALTLVEVASNFVSGFRLVSQGI
jgi:hypothetical protein